MSETVATKDELAEVKNAEVVVQDETMMGFEDADTSLMIIPRIKVVNALSPERKDKTADEGDLINSLSLEKLQGKCFVPVKMWSSNIKWKDRADGGGIACSAKDGKIGSDGIPCLTCRMNEFDNTKAGKDSHPTCSKYINFLGFMEGEAMPILLSFAKTNYKEGKKLFSLAKITMQNMWNNKYRLDPKLMKKNGNEWYICDVTPGGATTETDRAVGLSLYKAFGDINNINVDMEERTVSEDFQATPAPEEGAEY